MVFDNLATVVSSFLDYEVRALDDAGLVAAIANPSKWLASRKRPLYSDLEKFEAELDEFRRSIREKPYILFRGIFKVEQLPETPKTFVTSENSRCEATAKLAIVVLNELGGLETVSYGSENAGALFVNLVAMEGEGVIAEKSKSKMRGHTDAASFPFRGTLDARNSRIAPSPDVVCLVALRNPDEIPTNVVDLELALGQIRPEQLQLLKGNGFLISSQRTFRQGTEKILGEEHYVDGGNILWDTPHGTWVRYSHRNVTVIDDQDTALSAAKTEFEQACANSMEGVVLMPGDVVLVNNRRALHGRTKVGDAVGGQSRWLLRAYGLDTTEINSNQRHEHTGHVLFP